MERIKDWKQWSLLRQGREADDVLSSTPRIFRAANTTSRMIPAGRINYLDPLMGKGRKTKLMVCVAPSLLSNFASLFNPGGLVLYENNKAHLCYTRKASFVGVAGLPPLIMNKGTFQIQPNASRTSKLRSFLFSISLIGFGRMESL